MDQQTFAKSLLTGLGIPPTKTRVAIVVGWENAEGGNWANSAKYNPLNTTRNAPGAVSINSVGVKAYRSWGEGLTQTILTLHTSGYGYEAIVQGLRDSDPSATATAIGNSKWGTNAQLAQSAIASSIKKGSGSSLLSTVGNIALEANPVTGPAVIADKALGDPVGTVVNGAGAVVNSTGDALKIIGQFFSDLVDPSFWLRVGKGALGTTMVVIGTGTIVYIMANQVKATETGRALGAAIKG